MTMTPLADGMARLSAVLPGLDATAMMQTLEARAASQRAAGSRTPARALEADLLVEAVLRSGRLTAEQASTVATTLDGASPETCARIDRLIAEAPEALQGRGRRRLASDLRAMIQQLEPDGSQIGRAHV